MGKIKFCADATEMGLPFIKLEEGEFKEMTVLIDTGSNDNVIWGFAHNQMSRLFEPVEGRNSLYGIDGKPCEVKKVCAKVPFFGKVHEMSFLVREDDEAARMMKKDLGITMHGIIGTKFMVEHGWVLDFAHQEIVIPNTDVSVEDLQKLKSKKNE